MGGDVPPRPLCVSVFVPAPSVDQSVGGVFLLCEVAALALMPEQNTPTGAGVGRGVG